jgi:hypothetical protein
MKKILSLVILLVLGIAPMVAQNCFDCDDITKAFSIGYNTTASNLASFAGGNSSNASGNYSFAFGNNSNAMDQNGIALGSNANAFQAYGIAIGNYVQSNAANSCVFGMGGSSNKPLSNSLPNSLMFGVTHKPSLTIWKPDGADRGYLGIGTDEPAEMMHVVGKLLIDRTEETESSLQFKHPNTAKDIVHPPQPYTPPYYWDIYSDIQGLKFNKISGILNPTTDQLMVLSRTGYLGIGIETPLAKLHVNQNIIAEGDITTFNKLVLAPDNNFNSERWEISRTNAGLNYAYNSGMLSQNILFVGSDGFVGVGKTNPSATLDVNGLFKAADVDISGVLSVKTLNAQNATIEGILSADELSAGSATVTGAFSANSAKIAGRICAKEVLVALSGSPCWPDYVFNKDYKLPSLNELEQFIAQNQHLPNVPSAAEVEANGVELGEMNALLLQKVEELTLYILDLQKQINELKNDKP